MSQPIIPLESVENENPLPVDPENNTTEVETSLSQQQQQEQSYYNLLSINSTIVIRQLPSQGLSFQLWPAATTLVNFLDDRNRKTTPLFNSSNGARPLRILELGSGTGVVGIAAAALLGAHVTVTDLPHVLPNMEFNVLANAAILETHGGVVDVTALSWGDNSENIGREYEYDVILGSDIVYYDHLYEPLLETLRFFLTVGSDKDHVVVFLMAHLKRWKKESAFFKRAKKFLDVEVIHTDSPRNGSRVGVTVYKFVRKGVVKKMKSGFG